ncbi:type II toxin-antitoxin system RelE family toxin [Actinomadura alba]|uniref:Type II toxin-antitoxin system RelE/ParE family toxin n=1 Tax=Actinomadura alba TaxID=406431 RepID=A0ABR7M1Q4_9ACTN|nr:type II toxin-antitoxin system RelE/ParE family toxin [Actinomadura alba]MBC6471052.1 type II toxin-antitoxin system RelE/ParE family toxin [Actinomadura alba]
MSYAITWSERATSTGSRYLADDAAGLAQVLDATDMLADDPRPVGSFPYGSEDLRRSHVGRYRVLYEIYPAEQAIMILHVGRIA